MLLAATLVVAALASCGGSGGGGGGAPTPIPTVALTASNAQNVAGDVTNAGVQTAEKAPSLGLAAQLPGSSAPRIHVLSRFLERQISRILQSGPATAAGIAATAATTTNCLVSGTQTEDQSANSVVKTFNACSDAVGESINGSVAISGISATASGFSASISTNLTFSFTGFADQTFTGNFGFSESVSGTLLTITISGAALVLHTGTNTENLGSFTLTTTIDTSTSGTTDTLTFSYSSTEIGGTVLVRTLTPFQIDPGSEKPHAGVLQIIGVNGSSIKVTVNGDELDPSPQVKIQLDADGDGVFELTLDKSWAELS